MATVLLLVQVSAWALAGLSALPLAVAERGMLVSAALTGALVACGLLLAAALAERRLWARGWTVALEWTCLVGSLLLLVLPIGTPHGLVALLVNVCLPVAVLALLMGRRGRRAFGQRRGATRRVELRHADACLLATVPRSAAPASRPIPATPLHDPKV